MSRYYSGDPYKDFDQWDMDYETWLAKRPQCHDCGENVQEEYGYRIDGNFYCQKCIDECKEFID